MGAALVTLWIATATPHGLTHHLIGARPSEIVCMREAHKLNENWVNTTQPIAYCRVRT